MPHWRLIPVSDRAARRICGLVLALAIVYGVTTLLYVVTRVVQAPFALTVAVALPSSLLMAGIITATLLTPLDGQHSAGSSLPATTVDEKVKNWTLRDNIRRIAIPVRVAHGSDPRVVKSILLKVAQDPSRCADTTCAFRRS